MGVVERNVRRRIDYNGAVIKMILLNDVHIPLNADFSDLKLFAAKELKTEINNIKNASVYRKSVDARKKTDVHFCCSLAVNLYSGEEKAVKRCRKAKLFEEKRYEFIRARFKPLNRPVVVGFGPAGMFAALTLSRAGLRPIVIERGADVDKRSLDVEKFLSGGPLDPESNVQFGEGGAGTFSDGKLNTGIKDPRCREILSLFVAFGAPENILTDAKPHIGTDILKTAVKNLRKEIENCGGEIRFGSKLQDINISNGAVKSITVNDEEIKTDSVFLAIGHSARDTFKMLKSKGVFMTRKPFAMGVRIEHLQSDINRALYGEFADDPALCAADYKLSAHLDNNRSVYTFCMCPGGEVINASSENKGIAVNGMSYSKRDGVNANSALLVGISPDDLEGDDPLEGCILQRSIEQKAYAFKNGSVPITTVGNLVYNKEQKLGKIKPTVRPDFAFCDIRKILPDFITDSIAQAIKIFARKIEGFDCDDAVITLPETRSSSPVRIVRDENGESTSARGLYPCGEGAGYAGGIMSAAADGMRQAEAYINFKNRFIAE